MYKRNSKYNIILLSVFILATVLFSCSGENDSNNSIDPSDTLVTEPAISDNTIFVFMPWSDLYPALKVNIKDMLTGIKNNSGLGNDKLIIYICSSSYSADLIQAHYKKYIKENSIVDSVILDTLKRYDHPDYYTTSGISSILNEVAGKAPGNHYSMIIGSHAIGWISIAAWQSLSGSNNAKQALFSSSSYKMPLTRAFGGIPNQIENDTLANAIQNSKIKKLRYLLFDDCYMGNMETAYGFRNITDYMVASTCEIMSYGMPYVKIWKYLVGNPDYENICNEFYNFYYNYTSPYGTLSVINCDECDDMASVMKEINSKCVFDNNDSVQVLDGIKSTIYYDMGDYVKSLCNGNAELYSKFSTALNKLVPYHCNTKQFYSDYSKSSINIKTFSGISISDLSNNVNIAKEKLNTAWYLATHDTEGSK